jgi:hypothetical protein
MEDDEVDSQSLLSSLSTAIQSYISTNYSGYMVDDVENDTLCDGSVSGTEVELEDANDMEVGLFFDASDNLIYTANEIDAATLPQQVTNLISSNYASYTLDTEAETMTFADGSVWYEVVIEDTAANSALELTISEGTVVCSEPYDDED